MHVEIRDRLTRFAFSFDSLRVRSLVKTNVSTFTLENFARTLDILHTDREKESKRERASDRDFRRKLHARHEMRSRFILYIVIICVIVVVVVS